MRGRIFTARDKCYNYVRVCSSQTFYIAQIKWSIKTVARYWHVILESTPRVLPKKVPSIVRFCLSWILGTDCVDEKTWPDVKLHAWLLDKLSDGAAESTIVEFLSKASVNRRTTYYAMYEMNASPPLLRN